MRLLCCAGQNGLKQAAAAGVNFVRQRWHTMAVRYPTVFPRESPQNPAWDVHVNVPTNKDYMTVGPIRRRSYSHKPLCHLDVSGFRF